MKRSEMVSFIEREVNDRLADCYSHWDARIAEEFLTLLEKAGMRPSGHSVVMVTGKVYNPETDFGRDVIYKAGWEKE